MKSDAARIRPRQPCKTTGRMDYPRKKQNWLAFEKRIAERNSRQKSDFEDIVALYQRKMLSWP